MREVLRARRAGQVDDFVVGLTVEGGGMRGVVSAGMLVALRELRLTSLFDHFYGSSAGALNLAYFAAGAGAEALAAYLEHLRTGFVRRVPRPGRPLLNMGRVAQILNELMPLDRGRLESSSLDARIVVTDLLAQRPVVLPLRRLGDALVDSLLASAWLPILAGPPRLVGGRRFLDGGLLWLDPGYAALAAGCTHIVMLSSSLPEPGRAHRGSVSDRVLVPTLNRWSPGLGKKYRTGARRWAKDRTRLVAGRENRLRGSVVLRVQCLPDAHRVGRLTLDRALLEAGARAGHRTLTETLGGLTSVSTTGGAWSAPGA